MFPTKGGGYQTFSSSHHECPSGNPHIQGIACNTSNPQELTAADCVLTDGSFADFWSFPGVAGEQVTITMTAAFDTYLFLLDPSATVVTSDDDSGGGTDSRIVFTLTSTGTWFIVTNSFSGNVFGPYTMTLACAALSPTPTLTPTATVSTPTTTSTPATTPTPTPFVVTGDPNCGQFAVLSCPAATASASLTSADCRLSDGSYFDFFRFSGTQGQTVTVDMSSAAFDTFVFLLNPVGEVVASDDDGGGALNSHLVYTLTATGTWSIATNSFHPNTFGPYLLHLNCAGGIGVTATPLGGEAVANVPTLSLSALALLAAMLVATAFVFLRRA